MPPPYQPAWFRRDQGATRFGRLHQTVHLSGRPCTPHFLDVSHIHTGEVRHIHQENVNINDIIRILTVGGEHNLESINNLHYLRFNICPY